MGYSMSVVSGFSWQTALKGATYIVTFGKLFVLARILSPSDFGLFSLVAITLGIMESVTETGVNITLLQAKQSLRYYLDSAWVISIIRGLLIGLIMLLVGLGLEKYFSQPELIGLISIAAIVPVVKGFINPMIVSYQKNLQFFQDSAYRFALVSVEAISVVGFALALHSVYAFVLGILCAAVFEVLLSQVLFADRPRFHYAPSRGYTILSNAWWLSPASFLHYVADNCDDFIIGKMAGTYNLGIYHNGYALSHKLNYDLSKSVFHASVPVYTKIIDSPERLKRAFWKSSSVALLLIVLLSSPVLIFPDLVVNILLGAEWHDVVPIVRPLVFAGIFHSVSTLVQGLLLAKKNYLPINLHLLLTVIAMMGGIYLGFNAGGLYGATVGLALARLAMLPLIVYFAYRSLATHAQ